MPRLADLARLVRLPAVLTVPGDALAGAAAAGWPLGGRTAVLPLSSALLYTGGMALNDWADRDVDAVERPERPIPSGAVTPAQALALGCVLTTGGVAVATLAGGRRAARVALPLGATVWAYDTLLKATPLGPIAMAAARGLDVALGAGGARRCLPAALAISVHALAITALSRDEVTGSARPARARAALATTAGIAAMTGLLGPADRVSVRLGRAALAAGYLKSVGAPQLAAARRLDAIHIRRAVGAGVLGTVALQATLLARGRALPLAIGVALLGPVARRAARAVSPT